MTSDSDKHGTANGVSPFAADVREDKVVSPSHALLTTIVRIVLRGSTFASNHLHVFSIARLTNVSLSDLLRFFSASWFHRLLISSAVLGANPHRVRRRLKANVPIPSVFSVDSVLGASLLSGVFVDVCMAANALRNASGVQEVLLFVFDPVDSRLGVFVMISAGDAGCVVLNNVGKSAFKRSFFHFWVRVDSCCRNESNGAYMVGSAFLYLTVVAERNVRSRCNVSLSDTWSSSEIAFKRSKSSAASMSLLKLSHMNVAGHGTSMGSAPSESRSLYLYQYFALLPFINFDKNWLVEGI